MQVLSGGDSMDRNEPSTSGVTYHRNEPIVERQSSSTSTDSGLHLQEKIKVDWPFKNLSHQSFIEKSKEGLINRQNDLRCLQSLSEIWKYREENGQDFLTVSTDCFPNESNTLVSKRDTKCASSDYSTSSDVFTKENKDVGRTSSYQLVFTSSDIDYPIVEHCEEHCSSHGIIHTTIDSDDDEEAGSRSPLLNCHEDWEKICAEVKIIKADSDIEVAFIEENKPKGIF